MRITKHEYRPRKEYIEVLERLAREIKIEYITKMKPISLTHDIYRNVYIASYGNETAKVYETFCPGYLVLVSVSTSFVGFASTLIVIKSTHYGLPTFLYLDQDEMNVNAEWYNPEFAAFIKERIKFHRLLIPGPFKEINFKDVETEAIRYISWLAQKESHF